MARPAQAKQADPLLDAFWERGLILMGKRVEEEYALHTPIFINLRQRLHDDLDLLHALGTALYRKALELASGSRRAQQVVGIPDTATPLALAAALASRGSGAPLLYGQLRKQPAAYPGGQSGACAYMGVRDASREITLIDDVMASGKTKKWAIGHLREAGLDAARILVVVDRGQGGDRILRERGYPVHSLYDIRGVIAYYLATGRVDEITAREAVDWLDHHRFPAGAGADQAAQPPARKPASATANI